MTRRQAPPNPIVLNPAYRRAFQRLDETLDKNTNFSNAEIIKLMREAMFADVDALEKSGTLIIPKY